MQCAPVRVRGAAKVFCHLLAERLPVRAVLRDGAKAGRRPHLHFRDPMRR